MTAKSKTVVISFAMFFALSSSLPSFAQTSSIASSIDGTPIPQNVSSDGPARGDAAELAGQLGDPGGIIHEVLHGRGRAVEAGFGEIESDRAADAAGCARDERDLALQSHCSASCTGGKR